MFNEIPDRNTKSLNATLTSCCPVLETVYTTMSTKRKSTNSPDGAKGLADTGWIDVQKKTFTNWVNDKLKSTESQVEELQSGLKDGVALITLLQILAPGKKMPGK